MPFQKCKFCAIADKHKAADHGLRFTISRDEYGAPICIATQHGPVPVTLQDQMERFLLDNFYEEGWPVARAPEGSTHYWVKLRRPFYRRT